MSISEHYRYKIVNEISWWKDTKVILEKYKDIWLTYNILSTILEKSTKCRIFTKDWKHYRKCIYCQIPKEINEENFRRDPTKKFWFATICKYHAIVKQQNRRKLNRAKHLEQHNEQQKRYQANNPEKIKEYRKNFYQENKERLNKDSTIRKRKKRAADLQEKICAARNN